MVFTGFNSKSLGVSNFGKCVFSKMVWRSQIAMKKWEVREGRVKAKHLSRCLAEGVARCCDTRST